MGDKTTLEITIDRRLSLSERAVGLAMTFGAVLTVPTFNHVVLGGGWALDLFGAAFGLVVLAGAVKSLGPKRREFTTREDAARWVASGEWEDE